MPTNSFESDANEELYLIATNEVDSNEKNEALWAKAIALVDGNENQARYKYIKLRVYQLDEMPINIGSEKSQKKFAKKKTPSLDTEKGFLLEYIDVEKFSEHKSIPTEKVIKMVRDGYYEGRLRDDKWYVHRKELSGCNDAKVKIQSTPSVELIPVSEFSEIKGISTSKVIEMIRDGFYEGRLIEGEWFASYNEVSNNTIQESNSANIFHKLIGGHYGLPKTYWLFGVFFGWLLNILIAVATAARSDGALIFFGVISFIYMTVVSVGIWRASNFYKGPIIWAGLAKIAVSIGWILGVFIGANS